MSHAVRTTIDNVDKDQEMSPAYLLLSSRETTRDKPNALENTVHFEHLCACDDFLSALEKLAINQFVKVFDS